MKFIFVLLLILSTSIFFIKYWYSAQYLNQYNVQGRKFEIYRDDKGIPHIYGYSQQDILFGKGFAQAQDRLWSLFTKKFLLQGRLSQLFGRTGLPTDYFARNFKFHQVGKMNSKILDPQTRDKAQAYCDGLNYYARKSLFLPIQFYVFWVQWQDWTIQNTIGLLAFTTFSLQYDYMYQIARQRLLQTVGFDLAYQIINFGSKTLFRQTTIMKEEQLKQLGLWKQYDKNLQVQMLKKHWINKNTSLGSIHLPTFEFQGSGSNAWVVSGQHTETGRPILANDPHLASLAPPAFYVCELVLLDQANNVKIQSFGASMSGVPAISSGMNNLRAWGSTASYVDSKDLFYQTVRVKDDVFQYFHDNQWKNFSQKQQIYKIRWEGQQKKIMYQNHRGPVIQDIFDQIYYKFSYPMPLKYRINHTITMDAALYRPDPYSLAGLMNITFTQDPQIFFNAGKSINFPNIDSVYINSTGHIGYVAVGNYPIRQIYEMSGFMKDGTVSKYDMKGFLQAQKKPQIHNPKKGYFSMCNNKFAPDEFIHRGSQSQITTGRSYRIDKVLSSKIKQGHKFSFQDMKKLQLDTKDEFLSQVFPLVLEKLNQLRYIWSNAQTEKYYQLLKKWDYLMNKESIEPSIYHVWERLFQSSLLLETDLNDQQRQAIINHVFFQNYQFRLFQKIHRKQISAQQQIVCRNQQTRNYTQLHPCQISLALAFKKVPQQLYKLFKTDNEREYFWGNIHQATFKSIPFSEIPLIGKIWQRQTPHGGNSRTLNLGILTHQSKGENKYRSIASPVFRFITDLNKTYWSLDIGNSGNLLSQFYTNFMGKDQYVEYKPQNPKFRLPSNWKLTVKGQM